MKRKGFLVLSLIVLLGSSAAAGDFDWVKDFNIWAQADPTGFRARIAARFQIGDAQITAVLGNVSSPADAYIAFRLGEMSRQPTGKVAVVARRGKAWRTIASRTSCGCARRR